MSCGEEKGSLAGNNILDTDPEVAGVLNKVEYPDTLELIDVAKAFVANHHQSSEVINKFIDECAIRNGVLPANCDVSKESDRCASPTVDVHYKSPNTDFTLSVAVSPDGFGGPAHDAIQDNLSQGPGQ